MDCIGLVVAFDRISIATTAGNVSLAAIRNAFESDWAAATDSASFASLVSGDATLKLTG